MIWQQLGLEEVAEQEETPGCIVPRSQVCVLSSPRRPALEDALFAESGTSATYSAVHVDRGDHARQCSMDIISSRHFGWTAYKL